MPRGDELDREWKFSDRDDESDDLGYGGGGSSFDDDDDEDGGWVLNQRDESLWDDADESDDGDDDEGEVVAVWIDRHAPVWPPRRCLIGWAEAVSRMLPVQNDQFCLRQFPNECPEGLSVDRVVGRATLRSVRDHAQIEGD